MAVELAPDRVADGGDTGPILIAGGGIGGLAVAIALARIGCLVRVLEQRVDASEEGAGIQIGPNGVHALRQLGVALQLEPNVTSPREIMITDGLSGRSLTRLPLVPRMMQAHGAPYWVTRRSDLHRALLSTVRSLGGIEIVYGFRIDRLETKGAGIQVRSGDGRLVEGAALIGADGLRSTVARVWLRGQPPKFTQRTAARALLPREALDGHLAAIFAQPVTGLWLGPKAHLVHYPVDAGRYVNVVAIVEGGIEDAEWGAPIAAGTLLAGFEGWSGPVRDLLLRAGTATDGWRRWSLMERPHLPAWSDGPVTVLGDAAHPVLPFLAQGAVLALEDAVTLASAVSSERRDLAAAFRVYGAARQERARRVVNASRRNGQIYHLKGIPAAARNAAMAWLPAERLMAEYDWLYGFRCPEFASTKD